MVRTGELILVAVSGGPDSAVLLHALWALREEFGYRLIAAHLNHLLRGEAAIADHMYVKDLAQELNLPVVSASLNVAHFARVWGRTIQDAARRLRYAFLLQCARQHNAQKIALGHNFGDQAETVLFRFLRGTGADGLAGMSPVRKNLFIRPFLGITRSEIMTYARQHRLRPRQDASNEKTVYMRNKLRLELIPLLEKEYNARFQEAAVRLADICREEAGFLNDLARQTLASAARPVKDGLADVALALDLVQLREVARPVLRRVLRLAFKQISPDRTLSAAHVEDLLQFLAGGKTGGQLHLPGKVAVHLERERLVLVPGPAAKPLAEVLLMVPGETVLTDWGLRVVAERLEFEQAGQALRLAERNEDPRQAFLDWQSLHFPLQVRSRRPGDRFRPLGSGGGKKLQDYLVDRQIPRWVRDHVPVFTDDQGIVWMVGHQIDERVRIRPESRVMLVLRAKSLDDALSG